MNNHTKTIFLHTLKKRKCEWSENLKTILFIGTNKSGSSREATRAAESLGYFVVLFTNNPKQIEQRKSYPEIHRMVLVDTHNIPKMKQEIHKLATIGLDIKTIVSFVDPYVNIASTLCDQFCHNATSSKAIKIMEDKEETRKFLADQPYSPKFTILSANEALPKHIHTPAMIKSPQSTGSKDVLLAENKRQAKKYLLMLREKYPEQSIIIEEVLKGPQYLVEVVVEQHRPHIIAVIKQDITKGKRFIITGYNILATVPPKIMNGLEEVVQSIVKAFQIETGAMHLELRLTKNGWKLIEINPRISGGAMNKMIEAAFGIHLVRETLKLFLGEKPQLTPLHHHFVHTKYLIVGRKGILEKVTGKLRASKLPGVYDVYVKPRKGTLLIPPLSMGHRYAYIITQGTSSLHAKRLASKAASEIKFHMRKR